MRENIVMDRWNKLSEGKTSKTSWMTFVLQEKVGHWELQTTIGNVVFTVVMKNALKSVDLCIFYLYFFCFIGILLITQVYVTYKMAIS